MKNRITLKILIALAVIGATYVGFSLYVDHSIRSFYFNR